MRRSGDRIRISIQLIRVEDGLHLWSETYDRALSDVFAVQDDIAQCTVTELRAALEGYGAGLGASPNDLADVARMSKGRASHPEAHRLYLVGKHLINRLNREDLTRAIQKLHEAVALDPRFALAWTELAGAYLRAATWGLVPQKDAVQQARDAVQRALSHEPELAEAHARLATIQLHQDWNWKGAEASCARALELAPGDASALNVAGVIAMALGRTEQSIALHRRAAEQDPLSASPHNNLGVTLHSTSRFVEAETELRRALELAPQRLLTRAFLARAIADQGRGEEALVEVMREPDEGERLYMLAVIQHGLGDKAASDAALQQLIAAYGDHYASQIADAQAARGHADAAFEWLERAYVHRDLGLCELRSGASFRCLHGDPRWRTMLVKLGLEEATST
jgi:Tfp pilus assembly protein PilF